MASKTKTTPAKDASRSVNLDAKTKGRAEERELVVLYLLQEKGEKSISELLTIFNDLKQELGVTISEEGIESSLVDLRRKGLVSVIIQKGNTAKNTITKYGLTKAAFANNIEVAHLRVLVPTLMTKISSEAKELLEQELNSGKSKDKGYRNPHRVSITCKVTNPIRATFQVTGASDKKSMGISSDNKNTCFKLYRNPDDKNKICIPHHWAKTWFASNMKPFNNSTTLTKHLSFADSYIEATPVIIDDPLPEGRGISTNECVPRGTTFVVKGMFPVDGGFLSVDQFKSMMEIMNEMSRTGFGKNNKFWGHVQVKGYKMTKLADNTTVAAHEF